MDNEKNFLLILMAFSLSSYFSYEKLTFAKIVNYDWNTEFDDNIELAFFFFDYVKN